MPILACFAAPSFRLASKPNVTLSTSFVPRRCARPAPIARIPLKCKPPVMRSYGVGVRDRIFSIFPYLLPLMDSLTFGKFVFAAAPAVFTPILSVLGPLYMIYRGVPFVAFGCFLLLYFLVVRNPNISRHVRFNAYQSLLLDIALLVPQLLSSFNLGRGFPVSVVELANSTIFYAILMAVSYAVITNARGQLPDQIPIVSESVNSQMNY